MSEPIPPTPAVPFSPAARTALAALLAACAALALLPVRAPEVPEELVPAGSAERALRDQEALSRQPRPMGTAAHAEARRHLEREIAAAGLQPEVQVATVALQVAPGVVRAGRVHNVLARLAGEHAGQAVLLAAHYDTVYSSPGASDDGAGVAALLETLRLLAAGPKSRNDVIFLFSDGEEARLLGAHAFARHPWAADVGLILNFEARGSRGPVIMFETGPGTGPLVGRYADLAPRPLAASYSRDVYRWLPNVTDFTVLRELGAPGFNFAFIAGADAYHSRLDDMERASRNSLLHHLGIALALGRHFAQVDLAALPAGGDAVFFNLPPAGLIVYPAAWSSALAVITALAVVAVAILGLRRRRLRPGRILAAFLLSLLAAAVAAALVLVLQDLVNGLTGLRPGMLGGDGVVYLAGWGLLGLGLAAMVVLPSTRRLGVDNVFAGGALAWALLTLATGFALPATGYLFQWPTLVAAVALALSLGAKPAAGGAARWVAAALAAAAALLLWVPTGYLLALALGFGSIVVLALLAGLITAPLLPALAVVAGDGRGRWLLPVGLLACGGALLAGAVAGAGYGPERPRADSLFYALDADEGRAEWASFDGASDAWTAHYLGAAPERRELVGFLEQPASVLLAAAPTLPLPPPGIEPVAAGGGDPEPAGEEAADGPAPGSAAGDGRLSLRVRSRRGAATMRISLEPARPLRSLRIDGEEVTAAGDLPPERWELVYYGPPTEGFVLDLGADAGGLRVIAVDRVYGLPEVPDARPRPPGLIPDPFAVTDLSLVKTTVTLPPPPAEPGGVTSEEPGGAPSADGLTPADGTGRTGS
jgi:hypothetical protein